MIFCRHSWYHHSHDIRECLKCLKVQSAELAGPHSQTIHWHEIARPKGITPPGDSRWWTHNVRR